MLSRREHPERWVGTIRIWGANQRVELSAGKKKAA